MVVFRRNYSNRIIVIVTLFSVGYSILRYNIAGDVSWKDLPFYVMNKGLALSSLILLSINFSLGPLKNKGLKITDQWMNSRRLIGITGFVFVLIHVLMSTILFNPSYYKVFFTDNGTLSLRGSLSLLGGVLSFIFLWIYNISFKTQLSRDQKFKDIVASKIFYFTGMFLTGIHLFFMGYAGWMITEKWQGGLPPVSLISFLIFLTGFIINLKGRV